MNVFTMAHRITHRVLCQGSFLEMTQIYHESVCRPEFWFKKGIDIIQSNAMNFRRLRSSIFSRWIVMADVISYSEHLHHQQSFINASLHQWLLIIISMFSRISSFFFRLSCHNEKRTFSVSLFFSPQYTRSNCILVLHTCIYMFRSMKMRMAHYQSCWALNVHYNYNDKRLFCFVLISVLIYFSDLHWLC